jgi:hypothetical protein
MLGATRWKGWLPARPAVIRQCIATQEPVSIMRLCNVTHCLALCGNMDQQFPTALRAVNEGNA